MSTLKKSSQVHVADICRYGETIVLPDKPKPMTYDTAIDILERRKKYEEEVMVISSDFDAFPLDGANAFSIALEKKYGWVSAEKTPGFFGPEPPQMISVEVARGVIKQVPWGRFKVPGMEEDCHLETSLGKKEGTLRFAFNAHVRRKYEEDIKELTRLTREILRSQSLYKGQAVKIRFHTAEGSRIPMPVPQFMDLDANTKLIYSSEVATAVEVNLFTPVENLATCRRLGIPIKRGVLLAGNFGTGKTLAGFVMGAKAVKAGVTFVYCEDARDFADALRFAAQYCPSAVFCEDIDRVLAGERDSNVDEILNILDGIDTKSHEIITVLTTNEVGKINPAILRPGRLDAVIHVKEPDANAAEALVRHYAGETLATDEDLTSVGKALAGQIPAIIRETVERSKLAQVRLNPDASQFHITAQALLDAAQTMRMQLELLQPRAASRTDWEKFCYIMAKSVHIALRGANGAMRTASSGISVGALEVESEEPAALAG